MGNVLKFDYRKDALVEFLKALAPYVSLTSIAGTQMIMQEILNMLDVKHLYNEAYDILYFITPHFVKICDSKTEHRTRYREYDEILGGFHGVGTRWKRYLENPAGRTDFYWIFEPGREYIAQELGYKEKDAERWRQRILDAWNQMEAVNFTFTYLYYVFADFKVTDQC